MPSLLTEKSLSFLGLKSSDFSIRVWISSLTIACFKAKFINLTLKSSNNTSFSKSKLLVLSDTTIKVFTLLSFNSFRFLASKSCKFAHITLLKPQPISLKHRLKLSVNISSSYILLNFRLKIVLVLPIALIQPVVSSPKRPVTISFSSIIGIVRLFSNTSI